MDTVAIMMSTYNGEKYLKEQIDSILNQKNVKVKLFVRDDGSKDGTVDILEKYKKEGKLEYIQEENLGPAKSFMKLVYNIDDKFDFFAFSDQDDIWEENKIFSAIKMIKTEKQELPIVYISNQKILYNGKITMRPKIKRKMNFYAAMVRNVAAGCTMVFNSKLLKYIKLYKPDYIRMHDVWIYKICECIGGKTIYDSNSYILYRQHSCNVEGVGNNIISKIRYKLKDINKNEYEESKTAQELLNGYSILISEDKKDILKQLVNYKNNKKDKIKLLMNKNLKSEKIISTLLFKFEILINKI